MVILIFIEIEGLSESSGHSSGPLNQSKIPTVETLTMIIIARMQDIRTSWKIRRFSIDQLMSNVKPKLLKALYRSSRELINGLLRVDKLKCNF